MDYTEDNIVAFFKTKSPAWKPCQKKDELMQLYNSWQEDKNDENLKLVVDTMKTSETLMASYKKFLNPRKRRHPEDQDMIDESNKTLQEMYKMVKEIYQKVQKIETDVDFLKSSAEDKSAFGE